ncbi:MAG: ROK family protein [Acidobacteriaceae bacterium]
MPEFVLAADIGGTNIRVARVSHAGRISHRLETPAPAEGGMSVVNALLELLDRVPQKGVRALGVGVPGLAYRNGDVWAPNLRNWKRMPLGKKLRERLNMPVVIESDRNAFVVGEAWKGVARRCRDVVFVAVGTGVGAGILMDGHLVRGHDELAGCVGWMAVRDKFNPQYARTGCLEAHAAGIGIAAKASRRFKRKITAREVAMLAANGDERAQKLLAEAGHYLGLGLANVVSTLNPEIIVLGGGITESGEYMLAAARETMARWAQPIAMRQTRVLCSRLGGAASLLGAAKLAFENTKGAES